jgi:hypothetical protein
MAITDAAPLRIGLADHGRTMTVSLILPGFATTVAELWVDSEEDADNSAEPGANGS